VTRVVTAMPIRDDLEERGAEPVGRPRRFARRYGKDEVRPTKRRAPAMLREGRPDSDYKMPGSGCLEQGPRSAVQQRP